MCLVAFSIGLAKFFIINCFVGSIPPSKKIAAITASTLSAIIAGLTSFCDIFSDFPNFKKSLKLCIFAISCKLFSQTTLALTLVISPSFNFG